MNKTQQAAAMKFYKRGCKYAKKHQMYKEPSHPMHLEMGDRSYQLITDAYNVLLINEHVLPKEIEIECTQHINDFVSKHLEGWEYPEEINCVLSLKKLKEDKKRLKALYKDLKDNFMDDEYDVDKKGVIYFRYNPKYLINIDYLIDGMTALGLKKAPLCCNTNEERCLVPYFKDLNGNGFCLLIPAINL
jgi:hypothetical protein